MKRVIATALVVAAAVTGVSVAEAAIRQGTFAGTTTAKDPVGFKVNSSGRVISFYYDGVTTKCSDGDTFPTPSGKFRVQTRALATPLPQSALDRQARQ